MSAAVRVLSIGTLLWLVFIGPPATIRALLQGEHFYADWLSSVLWLPLPVVLLLGVFRSKNALLRWWVFQYLGVSAIGFSAALCGALLSLIIHPFTAGWVAVVLFLVFCVVALRAAHRIHTVRLKIVSSAISSPRRLVQISDVHIGSRRPAFLRKVIAQVDAQQPDMLLVTGDLLDENVAVESLEPLSTLTYPAFYCSGNHERYVNYQQALDYIALQGVSVLQDAAVVVDNLKILGIGDREHRSQAESALDALCAESASMESAFSILLYHQPNLWSAAVNQGIDLTLSGHTHNGQIWPFGYLVRTRYDQVAGHFQSGRSHLFVSQGTGTWGPILRFGTRCEITVIELVPEAP